MKICIVTNSTNPGAGLGRVVVSLAKKFFEKQHHVGIVSSENRSVTNTDFLNLSLDLNVARIIRSVEALYRLRQFLRQYDVVLAFDVRPVGIFVHLACIGIRKPIFIQTLGTYSLFEPGFKLKNLLMSWVYRASFRIFIINTFVKKSIENSKPGFKFGKNLATIPVGVDTKLFHTVNSPTYTYGRPYILSVGAIKERKGQLRSIQAFSKVSEKFPDLHYVVVGDHNELDPYFVEIKHLIEAENITHRVHFVQKISDDDLMDLYSGAEFFILLPVSTKEFIEGFGMVYLEAALCGATSIGTYDTGAEAAIKHGVTGLLVNDTIPEITSAMELLLTDKKTRDLYRHHAKVNALSYDWSYIADMYEQEFLHITQ
ncbi:MAG: glycosyltransferase family 4 protein [Patescibacteria group bacterium]